MIRYTLLFGNTATLSFLFIVLDMSLLGYMGLLDYTLQCKKKMFK